MSSRWKQIVGMIVVGVAGVYGLIYWDVVTRAKESYLEGDKYLEWHAHPERKKEFFEKKFQASKADLDKSLEKKKLTQEEYQEKLETLAFDRDFTLGESSLKYAYQWYKDTYELFSPPESRWVKKARSKAPEVLSMWKKELREQNIPFEDTMFE